MNYFHPTTAKAERNLDANLPYPHSTEYRSWHTERLIFGDENKRGGGEYLDRLAESNREAHDRAKAFANESAKTNTARWFEAYLSEYFQKVVVLNYIKASLGTNGHAYYALGFNFTAPEGSTNVSPADRVAQIMRSEQADTGLQERIGREISLSALLRI